MERGDEDGYGRIRPEDRRTVGKLVHYAVVGLRVYLWALKLAALLLVIFVVLAVVTDPGWWR